MKGGTVGWAVLVAAAGFGVADCGMTLVPLDYAVDYQEGMLNYHLALSRLEETTGVTVMEGGH